ncbi:hypothetical protein J2X36_002165 [Methylobacterium sp. BE186]|uniref:hypothetical protein n=1 Tax=Methylobacterium sp. BE186 TaxID=2817715 RepID=UPI002857A60A|nr:hypothetical protein [Methylobacterium sp. BE186]MDR7037418.1 hypothetical protein [Methylobacterium sp. BE186]
MSYRERTGAGLAQGSAIQVGTYHSDAMGRSEVTPELGVMRSLGPISTDAWAALTPAEARELADDLYCVAREAEGESR